MIAPAIAIDELDLGSDAPAADSHENDEGDAASAPKQSLRFHEMRWRRHDQLTEHGKYTGDDRPKRAADAFV